MKRLLSLILALILIFSICSCSPDTNIKPSPSPNDTENNNSIEANTGVSNNNQPEIPNKASKNEEVAPSFNIDSLDYVKVKKADLKDKEISLFFGDNSFNIGEFSESEWAKEIAKKYDFKVNCNLTSDARLYSSQLIAQKTGQSLDLISTPISDIATTSTLIADSSTMFDIDKIDETLCPFSKRIFDLSGNKVFAGKGNAKVIWYNKDIVKTVPSDSWTVEDFKKLSTSIPENKIFLDTRFFTEFASCGTEQITGFNNEKGYFANLESEQSKNCFKAFADILHKKNMLASDETRFYKGNTALLYSDMPIRKDMNVDWLPLPKLDKEGTNVISLTGTGLGISKTASEENKDAAFTFAMLWCARYTEFREDTMMFDLGLSYERTEKYFHYAEKAGNIYCGDREINEYLIFDKIPDFLYVEKDKEPIDSVTNPIPFIQKRVELINIRNQ